MIVRNVTIECMHCGLPVPAGLIVNNRDQQFCCNGCSLAYELISANGLEAFYGMVDSSGADATLQRRNGNEAQFDNFDEPGFLAKFARDTLGGVREIRLALAGIHCAACVWLVEKLPTIIRGVVSAQVNWASGTIKLRWHADQVQLSQIAIALYRLGYTPHPMRISGKSERRQLENRQHLSRIGVAAAAAGNNMIIAAALYLGMFTYMESGFVTLLRWASCLVGVASLLGPGRVFLRGAWSAIGTRTPHMDLPIALGLVAGTLNGLINTIRGSGEIYFDSLSVLISLLLVGRWIQFRQQNRAADAIELLYRLTPQRARKLVAGKVVEVDVEDIEIGDLLEIRPGDLISSDSEVIEGRSEVDESILSGESRPVHKQVGAALSAGTKNLNSLLIARATAVGQETRISKIVELVEQASADKPQIVHWANRIGGYFVVVIIVLAVFTFGVWMQIDPRLATDHAVALLVVACPCALAMATPLAIAVTLGRMARRRIMIKSGDVIQALDRPGMIWLDKTGTLTEGEVQVVQWIGDPQWIPWVAAVERKFSHPIAWALVRYQERRPHSSTERDAESSQGEFTEVTLNIKSCLALANGVSADVEGRNLLIGNRRLLESAGVRGVAGQQCDLTRGPLINDWNAIEQSALAEQHSPCWIAVDGEVVGLVSLGDRIRSDAAQTLEVLRRRGWSLGILSGDHPEVVREVALKLGISNVQAGVTPEEKLAIVRQSNQQFATTVMVGDGVNDSAALAAATVGIAVHNGAEASLAAAPVYLGESGLAPLVALLAASRTTCSTIRRNFAASLGYNVIGAGLAMLGWIHPLLAAILMPVSSLTVIAISLRSGRLED